MFSGRDISYVKKFIPQFFRELKTGNGPLSEYMLERFEELQFKKNSEMIGNSLIFSFAGHDTTAHTLSWLIYELSKNKIVQSKLFNEIIEFWANQGNKPIEYDDLKRLPYLTRCIMETDCGGSINGTFRSIRK